MGEWVSVIIAFITGVIGPILVLYIKSKLEKKEKPDMVKETLRVSELVTNKIEHIKEEFNADRVWITQFHNGGHFYPTGKSIQKYSMVYELVSQYATSIRHNFQNIPINLFSRSINHLLEEDYIAIKDFQDHAEPTYGLRYIAGETGVKSCYMFALKSIESKMIGVLSIEFVKDKAEISHEDLEQLHVYAGQIGVLIDTYLKSK